MIRLLGLAPLALLLTSCGEKQSATSLSRSFFPILLVLVWSAFFFLAYKLTRRGLAQRRHNRIYR